jgi:hypothetical protein
VRRYPQLPDVVGTARSAGRFARRLDSRQQQRDEHADDRDHDQQLNQRKTRAHARTQRLHGVHGRHLPPEKPKPKKNQEFAERRLPFE